MEIELNGVHFWRLWFFEVFAAEIRFFDQEFLFLNSELFLGFLLVSSKIPYSHGPIFWKTSRHFRSAETSFQHMNFLSRFLYMYAILNFQILK